MLRDAHETEATEQLINHDRRSAMKKIAVGVGVVAGASILPESWTRPIIGQIVLPAHAATSGSSLHDPCAVELRSGDNTSATVAVKVTGFVTPPTAGLPVNIGATAVGGAGLKVEGKSTTDANGNFEAFLTIGGGPGITSVNVTTVVAGADGAANCVVHTTSAATPTATTTYYSGTYQNDNGDGPVPNAICFTITGSSLSFITYEVGHPSDTIVGTGTYPNASGVGGANVGNSTVNVHIDGIAGNTLSYTLIGTIPGDPPQTIGPISGTAVITQAPCNAG
jgi:hypothetical protein